MSERAHPLVQVLSRSGSPPPASFEISGEGMTAVTGADFEAAAADYRARLGLVPAELRDPFAAEQRSLAAEAQDWLARYNRNLYSRVAGYWELGKRLRFDYPWPAVAILGICQVLEGMWRSRFYGLVGVAARSLRYPRLDKLADATDDILRRTNRGIFHDSVPTVLYALRCLRLRQRGNERLARALEDGPLPPLFDEDSRQLIRSLGEGLRIGDPEERFRVLARLTMRHFDREQAVFSHHMGVDRARVYEPAPGWIGMMTRFRSVPSPTIVGPPERRRLEFRKFALPRDFDLRNHDSRVAAFGAAFVESVTGSIDDYLVAVDYLHDRFAAAEAQPEIAYIR